MKSVFSQMETMEWIITIMETSHALVINILKSHSFFLNVTDNYLTSFECFLCALRFLPDREKGEELCPLVPPFSLLLRDEDEPGLDVNALLENWRVLQSEKGEDKHEKKNLKSKQEA